MKMPKRFIYFVLGAILLFFFTCFSYLVHKKIFTSLDFNTTVHLQDHISRRFDYPFSLLSSVGQFEFMAVILAAVLLFFRQIKAGIVAFAFFIGFHLVEVFGKYFVHHPPPPQFMVRTYNIMQFPQYYVQNLNSYPSGHAGRTLFVTVIALTLVWQSRRIDPIIKLAITGGILAFDITMLVSRVYLGEHWFSDIIGGSLIGTSFGLFAGIFLIDTTKHTAKDDEGKKSLFPKYKIEIKKVE